MPRANSQDKVLKYIWKSVLLEMFSIKGKIFNNEYEKLHYLCDYCSKFGHPRDDCPIKNTDEAEKAEKDHENNPNNDQ